MAKADPGSDSNDIQYNSNTNVSGNINVGEDLAEELNLGDYNRAEVYTISGEGSGGSELYILDPKVDHNEEAIEEFAALFSEADLLVPSSDYYDVAWFIPRNTGFQADQHLSTSWGYVEGEREKYFLISDN
mgnify:FL=1